MEKRLDKLREVKWNVHIRERYAHGEGVAHYLARYLRGGPIGNSRLLPAPGGERSASSTTTTTTRTRPGVASPIS